MKLEYEIKKRKNNNDDIYSVIGAEIKNHRNKLSKTLKDIATRSYSISYISKIENNKAQGSMKVISDITSSVNITKEQLNFLYMSRDSLIQALNMFYLNDKESILELEQSIEGLDNHRTILIELICQLLKNDLKEAKKSIDKLFKLVSALADLDLMIFTTFYGIYLYRMKQYIEASNYLHIVVNFGLFVDLLEPLIYKYLFNIAFKCNSPNIFNYYHKLINLIYNYGDLIDLKEINKTLAYYYFFNNQERDLNTMVLKFKNPNSRSTFKLLMAIKHNNESDIASLNLDLVDEFSYLYYLISMKEVNVEKQIDESSLDSTIKNYLKYLNLDNFDKDKAYEFVVEFAFKNALEVGATYFASFYLGQIVKSVMRPKKYKRIADMYVEYKKMEDISRMV